MSAANWSGPAGSLISCLQRDSDDNESILKAIGQMYVQGCTPDFEAIHAGKNNRTVSLPTYPFQRRRFWGPDKPRAYHAQHHTAHPLLGSPVSLAGVSNEQRFESFIDVDSPSWLPDHEVINGIVLPGAAYVEMAIAAAGADQIQDIVFEQPLRLESRTALQTVLRKTEDKTTIETFSSAAQSQQWSRNFTAQLTPADSQRPQPIDRNKIAESLTESVEPADFYRKMQELGLNYGPAFQTIESLQFSKTGVLAHLKSSNDIRGYTVSPPLLDGALHSLAVGLVREDDGNLFLPVGIGRVRCLQAIENEVWCHATWKQNEGKNRTADLTLFNADGRVAVEIEDFKVQQVSVAALRQMSGGGPPRLIYDLNWERTRLPASNTTDKTWLIVSQENDTLANELSQQLLAKQNQAIEVQLQAGAAFTQISDRVFRFCGEDMENWQQLFEANSPTETSDAQKAFQPQGISWLTGDCETKSAITSILNLTATLAKYEQRTIETGWQLITTAAIATAAVAVEDQPVDPHQSQFWGMGRVLGAEQPELRCRLIDLLAETRSSEQTVEAVVEILLAQTQDNQFAIREGQYFVPRLKAVSASEKQIEI